MKHQSKIFWDFNLFEKPAIPNELFVWTTGFGWDIVRGVAVEKQITDGPEITAYVVSGIVRGYIIDSCLRFGRLYVENNKGEKIYINPEQLNELRSKEIAFHFTSKRYPSFDSFSFFIENNLANIEI